jgi:ribokinase
VILNPAPAQPLPTSLFPYLYAITPNETEAEILTGIPVMDEPSAVAAAKMLHSLGVPRVIITLGARGALVSQPTGTVLLPAPVVRAVDTTAAGDVFNGALAVALAENRDLIESVRFAIRAAAISVTRLGAQASAPSRAEVD